jgi:hypothetical protein
MIADIAMTTLLEMKRDCTIGVCGENGCPYMFRSCSGCIAHGYLFENEDNDNPTLEYCMRLYNDKLQAAVNEHIIVNGIIDFFKDVKK